MAEEEKSVKQPEAESKPEENTADAEPKKGSGADQKPGKRFGLKRRAKQKKEKDPPKVKRNWLLRLLVVALIAGGLVFAYRQLTDTSHFIVSFYSFEEKKIESPMRIAFLSDMHLNEFGKDNEDLTAAIRKLEPDIIVIGGDMNMMNNPDYSAVLTLCRQLVEIAPVYYGMGNHEYTDILFNGSNILTDLSALGVNTLSNRYMTIQVNGNLIDIGGLSETMDQFEKYGVKFWNKYDGYAKNYRLLLVHDPGYFRAKGALVGKNIDLALCGHFHGGQIILPVIGALYHPQGGFRPELAGGYARVKDTLVVTSRGLGNHSKLPRFNNPPELVVIDLR